MTLEDIRKEIDEVDDKIIPLLEKRLNLCQKTKIFKRRVKDPKREKEILDKIKIKDIQKIYKIIFKIFRKAQK